MTLSTASTVILDDIRELLSADLAAMNEYIRAHMHSEVPLIQELSEHIIHSGGKRIRPILVLLLTKALGYTHSHRIILAVIIEFIHTATLLHDDIVDEAALRRGSQTANALWGNGAAVLAGDFLYSRSFQMMVEIGLMEVMSVLADTTNKLAEGEVLQLVNRGNLSLTEPEYNKVIERKTARLFAAATSLTASLAGQSDAAFDTLYQFGLHFGYLYQLTDDALDYQGNSHRTGKIIGKDLEEGKMTLPLIYALSQTSHPAELKKAIQKRQLKSILKAIESTGAAAYTVERAQQHATHCRVTLLPLPDSPYKKALLDLVHFVVHRSH